MLQGLCKLPIPSQEREARLGYAILNQLRALGMPQSVTMKVKDALGARFGRGLIRATKPLEIEASDFCVLEPKVDGSGCTVDMGQMTVAMGTGC